MTTMTFESQQLGGALDWRVSLLAHSCLCSVSVGMIVIKAALLIVDLYFNISDDII